MREAYLFRMQEKIRERMLTQVECCSVDRRTVIPEGFMNNILWQLGHILHVTNGLVFVLAGESSHLPAFYQAFFGNGTRPTDWTEEPPSWETIISKLKEQPAQIRVALAGKLNEQVKENFLKAETIGELIQMNLIHESTHVGTINAMLKLLK